MLFQSDLEQDVVRTLCNQAETASNLHKQSIDLAQVNAAAQYMVTNFSKLVDILQIPVAPTDPVLPKVLIGPGANSPRNYDTVIEKIVMAVTELKLQQNLKDLGGIVEKLAEEPAKPMSPTAPIEIKPVIENFAPQIAEPAIPVIVEPADNGYPAKKKRSLLS